MDVLSVACFVCFVDQSKTLEIFVNELLMLCNLRLRLAHCSITMSSCNLQQRIIALVSLQTGILHGTISFAPHCTDINITQMSSGVDCAISRFIIPRS